MAAFGRADAIVDDAFEGVRDGIMAAEGKGDSDKLNALKNAVTNITTYPDQFSQGARNAASGMKANVDAGIYNPVDFTTMKLELGIDDDVVMGARRRRRGKKSRRPRKGRRMTRRRRGGEQDARRMRAARLGAPSVADAALPVTGKTSTEVPEGSIFQVAQSAALDAQNKAQDAEYAETARVKKRAPLEAKLRALEKELKAAQAAINQSRSSIGKASPFKIERKREIQAQIGQLEAELATIGGRQPRRKVTARRR